MQVNISVLSGRFNTKWGGTISGAVVVLPCTGKYAGVNISMLSGRFNTKWEGTVARIVVVLPCTANYAGKYQCAIR